jgi:hypothetical protein
MREQFLDTAQGDTSTLLRQCVKTDRGHQRQRLHPERSAERLPHQIIRVGDRRGHPHRRIHDVRWLKFGAYCVRDRLPVLRRSGSEQIEHKFEYIAGRRQFPSNLDGRLRPISSAECRSGQA